MLPKTRGTFGVVGSFNRERLHPIGAAPLAALTQHTSVPMTKLVMATRQRIFIANFFFSYFGYLRKDEMNTKRYAFSPLYDKCRVEYVASREATPAEITFACVSSAASGQS